MDAMVLIHQHKKELMTSIVLLLIGAFGNNIISESSQQSDVYTDRAYEVNVVMHEFLKDPSLNEKAYDELFMQTKWSDRQIGERNELFKEYISECDNVRVAFLHGEVVDTSKMNELYNELKN